MEIKQLINPGALEGRIYPIGPIEGLILFNFYQIIGKFYPIQKKV